MVELKRLPAVFYATASGREPMREWLLGLSKADRAVIGEDVKDVESSYRVDAGRPPGRDGSLEDVTARALKRVIARRLDRFMRDQGLSKAALARKMMTSRSQLDRLLDPQNDSVTLNTLVRAAHAVGRRLQVDLV